MAHDGTGEQTERVPFTSTADQVAESWLRIVIIDERVGALWRKNEVDAGLRRHSAAKIQTRSAQAKSYRSKSYRSMR